MSDNAYNPLDLLRKMRQEAGVELKDGEEVEVPFDILPEAAVVPLAPKPRPASTIFKKPDELSFADILPEAKEDEFLIEIEDGEAIFCVRELRVREAIQIEGSAFLPLTNGGTYFSSAKERKEILSAAISWVATKSDNTLIMNTVDRPIVRLITDSTASTLWDEYSAQVYVDEVEGRQLYLASKAFFMGQDPKGPIPLETIYVNDLHRGWFHFSFQEYLDMKMSFYERLQIASMALAEAQAILQSQNTPQSAAPQEEFAVQSMGAELDLPAEMYPPHIRARMGF